MVDVKVIREFKDRTDNLKLRKKNEILKVSEERAKKLEGLMLVERLQEQVKKEPKQTAK